MTGDLALSLLGFAAFAACAAPRTSAPSLDGLADGIKHYRASPVKLLAEDLPAWRARLAPRSSP